MPTRRLELQTQPQSWVFTETYQIDREALDKKIAADAAQPSRWVAITHDQYNSAIKDYISSSMQNDDYAFSVSDNCSSHDTADWEKYFKETALTSQSIQQDLATTNPDSIDGNVYYQCFNSTRITSVTNDGTDYLNNLVVKTSFYKSELESNFQGEEQKTRVKELNDYVEKLVEKFADATAGRISKKLSSTDSTNSLTQDKIKTNIENIFKDNLQKMQGIISEKADKWQTVLQTGGDYLSYFRNKLETATTNITSDSNTADKLNYSDLRKLIFTTAGRVDSQTNNGTNTPTVYDPNLGINITSILLNTYSHNNSTNTSGAFLYILA